MSDSSSPLYPDVVVHLVGHDGNAFAILAYVRQALRKAKVSQERIETFMTEATSGDYDHLLQTVLKWVTVK